VRARTHQRRKGARQRALVAPYRLELGLPPVTPARRSSRAWGGEGVRALNMLRNKTVENPWKKHDNIPL
jgi:hypothetical protein